MEAAESPFKSRGKPVYLYSGYFTDTNTDLAKTTKKGKKPANFAMLEKHKWKKGETGNPNGRPKKIPSLEVLLKELLGTDGLPEKSEMFKVLKSLLADAKNPRSRHKSRAAEILLDRAFGKAVEKVKDEDEEKESKERVINVITDPKKIEELVNKSKPKDK